jgi:hypothetical protein
MPVPSLAPAHPPGKSRALHGALISSREEAELLTAGFNFRIGQLTRERGGQRKRKAREKGLSMSVA